jgi:hypothetical protein
VASNRQEFLISGYFIDNLEKQVIWQHQQQYRLKQYLRIQSVSQRKHNTSLLQKYMFNSV